MTFTVEGAAEFSAFIVVITSVAATGGSFYPFPIAYGIEVDVIFFCVLGFCTTHIDVGIQFVVNTNAAIGILVGGNQLAHLSELVSVGDNVGFAACTITAKHFGFTLPSVFGVGNDGNLGEACHCNRHFAGEGVVFILVMCGEFLCGLNVGHKLVNAVFNVDKLIVTKVEVFGHFLLNLNDDWGGVGVCNTLNMHVNGDENLIFNSGYTCGGAL